MPTPRQEDYGNPDSSTLVPGSLIVYRHFMISEYHNDALSSPGMGMPFTERGTYEAKCWKNGVQSTQVYMYAYHPNGGTDPCGVLFCPVCGVSRACDTAPTVGCSCGFYAHYDPATDFYPVKMWGCSGITADPYYGEFRLAYERPPVVRAVVEMSGRVVMGRLGVRAQKMRIKAIALDWQKFLGARYMSRPTPLETDKYLRRLEVAASYVGARAFEEPEQMYAEYPRPDLSALLPEPEPEPPTGIQITVDTNPFTTAAGKFLNGLKNANFTIDATFDTQGTSIETPMQRALRAKQNRPANPSAINYRKRGRHGK